MTAQAKETLAQKLILTAGQFQQCRDTMDSETRSAIALVLSQRWSS